MLVYVRAQVASNYATPWTIASQAPLSMAFSQPIRVGCHALLQGIFPTEGLNLCLLLYRWIFFIEPPGKPKESADLHDSILSISA